jgi:uncharacterized membrane protein YfcA
MENQNVENSQYNSQQERGGPFDATAEAPVINPLYTASAFAVGALVGLTGIGGGALMTPILILLFGVHPLAAVGTDLLFAAITKTGGTLAMP